MKNEKIPTEEEVRRFFQEAYYSTMTHDSETGQVKVQYHDLSGMIYPVEDDDVD